MPASGGAAAKLGDMYEALWAFRELLRVVEGDAQFMTHESLVADESRGVEFSVTENNGTVKYWSVKRQTSKGAGWTLALLTEKNEQGRSILGDLLAHIEREDVNRAVFASKLAARELDELRAYAASSESFTGRLGQSVSLRTAYDRLLTLCNGDASRARTFLCRIETHAANEAIIRDPVDLRIRTLFYSKSGTLDIAAVLEHLANLLLVHMHRPLNRTFILESLSTHGIYLCEWEFAQPIRDRINAISDAYVQQAHAKLINGALLPFTPAISILTEAGTLVSREVLVVGGAGGGKSTTLADVVRRLRNSSSIPVLPIRFDQLPDNLLTTTELGRKLDLPESPTVSLARTSSGAPSLLVVDQLDAVSIASGRRTSLWALFEALRAEVKRFPNMFLLVGCRDFDLEHDHRMRLMKSHNTDFTVVEIHPLTPDQVDSTLEQAGIHSIDVQQALKPSLVTPLYLSMFLSLTSATRFGVRNHDELFNSFWTEGEHRVDERLGRKALWAPTIDRLAKWLSDHQQISAPMHILDDYAHDSKAMASENILVLSEGRYRFFHESFFDYAFARRFAATSGTIVDLLTASQQHLFRRAQVRQILSFLRIHDPPRYLIELDNILLSVSIRFHLKRAVFQWLSSLMDPTVKEWNLLCQQLVRIPSILPHIRGVIWNHVGWFDVLDSIGFLDSELASGSLEREREVISLCSWNRVLEVRSTRIVQLLQTHRQRDERWTDHFRRLCGAGGVFHSGAFFEWFLALIDSGIFDPINIWPLFFSIAQRRPELACEAIGRWFARIIARWRIEHENSNNITSYINSNTSTTHVILQAAGTPRQFVEHLLPTMADAIQETAVDDSYELPRDPIGSFRLFDSDGFQTHQVLLSSLARSLEVLARAEPTELDRFLSPYQNCSHDTLAYLILRAWTAKPDIYADRIIDYLLRDQRRFKIGYRGASSDGGSAEDHVSLQAVRVASAHCSLERAIALEAAIVAYSDRLEVLHPQSRGLTRLRLLHVFEQSRLGTRGKAALAELSRKFPDFRFEPPRAMEAVLVGPPIAADAIERMTDDGWINALRAYSGVKRRHDRKIASSGGESELAHALQIQTAANPVRFAALASRMPNDLAPSYFDAILRGIESCETVTEREPSPLSLGQLVTLVHRIHDLPQKPCGQWLSFLIRKLAACEWPNEVLDIIAWYAIHDPDPDIELWKTKSPSDELYYNGDPYSAGINSTRGAAAGAITNLLFANPERLDRLATPIDCLTRDASVAVRSCAIEMVLAVLNFDPQRAITWFAECMAAEPALHGAPGVERFLQLVGAREYPRVQNILESMLQSDSQTIVETAARQACLLGLMVEVDELQATRALVESGTPTMRRAAADVYSTNVNHEVVGLLCRQRLRKFFRDPDDSVRAEAASVFQLITNLPKSEQEEMLAVFLDAGPSRTVLEPVIQALEDSAIQLPEGVCRVAEMWVRAYQSEAGNAERTNGMAVMAVSKLVVRLYAQAEEDPTIQNRCLDLIDEMERSQFWGISDELQRLDR